MNIAKAIEINKSLLDGTYDHRDEDMEAALKLGIEALERIELLQGIAYSPDKSLLPSQTKD